MGSNYFAINNILSLKVILPSPFMCIYVAIIAIILAVMLWSMDSVTALRCNGIFDGRALSQTQCTLEGAQYVNVQGSVGGSVH